MKTAFKEWAAVVDALGTGAQSLILRKGGIAEGADGFRMEHSEFLLFPTRFHQQRESVIESAQARYDKLEKSFPAADRVRMEYFAKVLQTRQLHTIESAKALAGQHIWRDEVIEKRFDWGAGHSIHAIAVRVFRLQKPCELRLLAAYSGCKSWVELAEEIATDDSEPVLSDGESAARLEQFSRAAGHISL